MRIPWSMVRSHFPGEWVELVECEWPSNRSQPTWASVRFHDKSRASLFKKISKAGAKSDAIVLFIRSSNLVLEHSEVRAAS